MSRRHLRWPSHPFTNEPTKRWAKEPIHMTEPTDNGKDRVADLLETVLEQQREILDQLAEIEERMLELNSNYGEGFGTLES